MGFLKQWRREIIAVALIALLFFVWIVVKDRSEASDLVGAWQGGLYPDTFFEFRANGTFLFHSKEANFRGDKDVTIRKEGTYRYRWHKIHFKVNQARVTGLSLRNKREWDRDALMQFSIPIKWRDSDEWQPTDVGMGTFRRIKALP